MNPVVNRTAAEAEIRATMADWLTAFRAGDLERIMSHYAGDVRAFDAVNSLQFQGRDAYRAHWAECMASCSGPIVAELAQQQIDVDAELALAHHLVRCGTVKEDGSEQAAWMRATIALRKIDDRWQVIHEHISAPFDMHSMQPLFDLVP